MNIEEFEDLIAITPTVCMFSGERYCAPCRRIKPYFMELKEEYKNLQFLYIDCESNEALAKKCGVKKVPCFKLFRNGVQINEFTGADKDQLQTCVEKLSSTANLC